MAKDDIGGVWRTIGGRRVFIKDGQDLATAMKESGKFKLSKKQIEAGKKLNQNAINGAKKDIEEYLKGNNEDWDNDEDFIRDLANEWGLDKEEADNLFNNVNQKEKQRKIGTTEYLMQKQREKGNYKDEKYNELQSKANETVKILKEKNIPEGAKFNNLLKETGVKTFADEIKEQSKNSKILSNKQLSNMTWEEVIQKNTEYYSAKSIYDFEGGKQGKYKYEDGWRDNGGAGVIKQSDLDKLITKEEWLKAKKG